MKIVQKEIKVDSFNYYILHLNIVNSILSTKLTDKEIEVLASFMSLEETVIADDMFNTLARKQVKKRLNEMSDGSLGNHLKSMIKKGFLLKNDISNRITISSFLIPDSSSQGYQFKLIKV